VEETQMRIVFLVRCPRCMCMWGAIIYHTSSKERNHQKRDKRIQNYWTNRKFISSKCYHRKVL